MQKVLRRSALAKSQAKRKARIVAEKEHHVELSELRRTKVQVNHERNTAVRREKFRRREDWELGPLSPWRNNMEMMQKAGFGVFSPRQGDAPAKPKKDRVKEWMIREGDRVCVIKGHATVKGQIGEVQSIQKDSDSAVVQGLNKIDMVISDSLKDIFQTPDGVSARNVPIPYDHLRVVYPLPDPNTGIPRDVIINKLVAHNRHFDVFENEEVFDRYLEPQNIRIPWPDKTEIAYNDEASDTLRVGAENESYTPTLTEPPIPSGVINELRNRYGKFRERHDEDYLDKKLQEDIETEAEELRRKSLMPRGARNVARSRRRHGSNAGMPDDVAAAIGAHMASRLPKAAPLEQQSP